MKRNLKCNLKYNGYIRKKKNNLLIIKKIFGISDSLNKEEFKNLIK